MSKPIRRICKNCDRELFPTERHWQHHQLGGVIIDFYCEDCMLAEVNSYAERTIMGMLDGSVPTVIKAKVYGKPSEVKGEGTEP